MTHTCTKVTVRQREIRNNRISLYLDYYPAVRNPETMQMSRRETSASTSMPILKTKWNMSSTTIC